VNAETYQGLNWPKIFFVNEGCGDCGLPEPPAQFFNHLFIVSIPTALTLLGLSVYKYIQKTQNIGLSKCMTDEETKLLL